jgi:hypothetical protein
MVRVSGGTDVALGDPVINAAAAPARLGQQLSGLAADLYQQQRDEQVVSRLNELDVERRQSDAAIVDAFQTMTGRAAVDGREQAMRALRQNAKRVSAGITDRFVAEQWARQDAQLTMQGELQIDGHYRQQNRAWQVDTLSARAGVLQKDLGRVSLGGGMDPATGQLSSEAERIRSAYRDSISEQGRVLGWSPERVQLEQMRADSQALGAVAEGLLSRQNYSEASRFLERYGDNLEASRREELAGMARVGGRARDVDTQAQQLADQLDQEGGDLTERMEMLQQLWQGEKIDVDVRDATRRRLREAEHDRREEAAYTSNQLEKEAREWFAANPFRSLEDNPQLLARATSLGVVGSLRQIEGGRPRRTDPEFLEQVRKMPLDDVEGPGGSTVRGLRSYSDEQLRQYLGQGLSDRDAEAMFQFVRGKQELMSREDRMKSWARQLGIVPQAGSWEDSHQVAYDQWRQNIEAETNRMRDKRGRDLTDAEIENEVMAPQLRNKVFLDGWGTDPEMPFETANLQKQATKSYVKVDGKDVFLGDVPRDRVAEIVGEMRRTNPEGAIDAREVVKWWLKMGRPGPGTTAASVSANDDSIVRNWPAFSSRTSPEEQALTRRKASQYPFGPK